MEILKNHFRKEEKDVIYFTIGLVIGIIVTVIGVMRLKVGTLRIDQFSSEKDLYRFEIDNLDKLSHKKFILLDVDPNADLSQK